MGAQDMGDKGRMTGERLKEAGEHVTDHEVASDRS